jgi:hypothetical protein
MINAMVNVYYRLIKAGVRSIDDIPEDYRDAVKALLEPDTQNEVEGE